VNELVYDSYEYVSVESNVRSLMQNKEFVELILRNRHHDADIIGCFQDGDRYKKKNLFSDVTKFSIMIQLFYDGMGTTNPLRGNASTSSVGVFY